MKKLIIFAFIIFAALTSASSLPKKATAQKQQIIQAADPIPGHYIVALNDSRSDKYSTALEVETEGMLLTELYGGKVSAIYSSALKGFAIEMTREQAEKMISDERVKFVEEDQLVSASTTQTSAAWHLDRIDQRTMPLDTTYDYSSLGNEVNVYVIDSGIRTSHSDFGGRADAVFDRVNDGQNGNDCYGHGTHVAGIIGSSTYGVAKNSLLHAVRVLNCSGQGSVSFMVGGIDWVTANHVSPSVANVSITVGGTSTALETAVTNSINSGVTYVVAAGNNSSNACNYSPGRLPAALTIGATANDDTRAGYSNYGSCVDLFAPGHSVISLSNANDIDTRILSGTSMASPVVAGVAALYLSSNPTASPATVGNAIKGTATSGILANTGTQSPNLLVFSTLSNQPMPTPTPTPVATPTPTPTPAPAAHVKIKKTVQNPVSASATVAFPYSATNLAVSSFVLNENTLFDDPNVQVTSGQTSITVTESSVAGWRLNSIDCTESSSGQTNIVNSTVDLLNHRANIIAEPGEDITCTFTSEPLVPTAAGVTVSGRVFNPEGRGLRNAKVSLIDSQGGNKTVTTNSQGYYQFDDVQVGQTYVVSVSSRRYSFSPRVVQIVDTLVNLDLYCIE